MRACTSISKRTSPWLLLFLLAYGPTGYAADDKTAQPEDEDYATPPFSEYGSFNEDADEAADNRFFQFGRFFGVSLGVNYEGVTGNRGKLWQGGFPGIDFRVHYWFDFNFAFDLGVYSTGHNFDAGPILGGANEVHVTWVGIDFKYYFETRNLSSGITFANPYLLLGFGTYSKTQTPTGVSQAATDKESKFGLSAGAGMEFAIAPRKTYFSLEGKMHFVQFKDSNFNQLASQGIPDLHGMLYTFTASLLFTW